MRDAWGDCRGDRCSADATPWYASVGSKPSTRAKPLAGRCVGEKARAEEAGAEEAGAEEAKTAAVVEEAACHIFQPACVPTASHRASRHSIERATSPEQPPRSAGTARVSEEHVDACSEGTAVGVSGGRSGGEVVAVMAEERSPQPPALRALTRSW